DNAAATNCNPVGIPEACVTVGAVLSPNTAPHAGYCGDHPVRSQRCDFSDYIIPKIGHVERSISVRRQAARCFETSIIIRPIVAAVHSGKPGDCADEQTGPVFCYSPDGVVVFVADIYLASVR